MAGAAKGFAAQEHGASALWDWDRTLERIHEAPLCRHVRRLDARRAQRRRFSTRKTPRPLKKGRCARPAGLRRGQEGHGPQAPHRCRHDWSPARRERSARRHSRSRAILLQQARRRFPLSNASCRIQGSKTATTIAATGCWTIEIVRRCPSPSFRGLAEPIDRRGDLRLDQPQSTIDARLRARRKNRLRPHAARHDSPDAQTPDNAKPLPQSALAWRRDSPVPLATRANLM